MERQRGAVYSPARRSGNTLILKLRAKGVTFEEFAAPVSPRMWLATERPTQGYQIILVGDDEPICYGAFVFEGADLKAVEAALAEVWGVEDVRLAEHLLHVVLDIPKPKELSDEDFLEAVTEAVNDVFAGKVLGVEIL